jgi:DNA-binding PadR family transcriptional regulator
MQMAYTEILILRHLASRPSHGYELRKRISSIVGISINNNSLYPALRRFVEAGAVRMTATTENGRPRHVYEITPMGEELLHDLIVDFPASHASDELEFVTRVGQFGMLTALERATILATRREAVTSFLGHFESLRNRPHTDDWADALLEHMRERTERELAWLAELEAKNGDI